MAIDYDETLARFGYRVDALPPTSGKLVVIICGHCSVRSERSYKRSKNDLTYCRGCTWLPEVMAVRGPRIKATRAARGIVSSSTPESQAKWKRTMLDRYGATVAPQTLAALDKARADYRLEHGGTPMQMPEVRAKRAQANTAKYGVDHPMKTAEIQEKVKATNRERTGFDNPFSDPSVRASVKETVRIKYGVDNVFQSQEVKYQTKVTLQAKYGVDHPAQSNVVQEKTRQTNQVKYGVDYAISAPETRAKIKQTCMDRFGVDTPWKDPGVIAKSLDTRKERYGEGYFPYVSRAETEVAEFVASLGLDVEREVRMPNNRVLDVVVRSKNIAVEYCGLFWHNERSPHPRLRDYHVGKMNEANKVGLQLVTLFEDEWLHRRTQVEGRLKAIFGVAAERIHARACTLVDLEADVAADFFETTHVQGKMAGGLRSIGLLDHDDRLVAAMGFGRHHRQQQAALVLSRMSFLPGVSVRGGASRMLASGLAWARKAEFNRLISWSDNRWSVGDVYARMGFQLEEELGPDYSYVVAANPKNRLSKQSQAKRLSKCPSGLTELQWATERGLARIWDCGRKRWVMTL